MKIPISPEDDLNMAAMVIRDLVPIAGLSATDAEVEARSALVEQALRVAADGIQPHDRAQWYEVTLLDDRKVGRWGRSAAEVVISCAMWWGVCVVEVVTP